MVCCRLILAVFLVSTWLEISLAQYGGHYSSFSGPVSGNIHQIQANHLGAVDFVAKPDYTFSYGVEDPASGNAQAHQERRDGDVVSGEYSVLEPDGNLRIVRYTADPENGFRADVSYSDSPTQNNLHRAQAPQPPPQQQYYY